MPEDKKSSKRGCCENCKNCKCCHKSILPFCCLISIFTALIVMLIFLFGLSRNLVPISHSSKYAGTFAKETTTDIETDEEDFVKISASAVLDLLYLSDDSGLIIVTDATSSDSVSADFLTKVKASAGDSTLYHYEASAEDTDADSTATNALIGDDSDGAPTLIYVRNGQIYDRLDDANSDAVIDSFIAKYR